MLDTVLIIILAVYAIYAFCRGMLILRDDLKRSRTRKRRRMIICSNSSDNSYIIHQNESECNRAG